MVVCSLGKEVILSKSDAYAALYRDCSWISFDILENFIKQCLLKIGVPEKDACIVRDVLIESDKRGIDSHGIGRLQPIYLDRIDAGILNPVTKIDVVKETETTAVLDGNTGMGHVVGKKAMGMAIEKARQYGLGMVVARNSTHYGIAGYYASMAIEAGMMGITGTNARPSIAPTHGVENMLGTNPLVFGFPTDEDFPFLLDCATSITQRGKVETCSRSGESLPPGWVIDREGNTQTDPDKVLEGFSKGAMALTPLGGIGEITAGFKGYGYATIVEVLSSAFQNGTYLKAISEVDSDGNKKPCPLGHFFIAIDIEHFIPLAIFKKISGSIMRDLRNSQKAPGADRIYTAGEKEYLARKYREVHGCPIPPALQEIMNNCRTRWNLDFQYPWDDTA